MRKDSIIIITIVGIILLLLLGASMQESIGTKFVDDYGTDYGAVLVLNFEEGTGTTAYDQSPYGNDGILPAKPSTPVWAAGKFGEALTFDGNDYVTVPDSASLDISDYITIEAWAKDPPIPFDAELGGNFEYNESHVWVDDSSVYLSATPHTIGSSGWVEFTLISKQYSGDIDVVWGFNTAVSRPTKPQIWTDYPHILFNWVQVERSYTNETGTYYYDSWEKEYYGSTFLDWKKLDKDFITKSVEVKGMDTWYILKNIHVDAGVEYKFRCWVDLPFAGNDIVQGKYAWGVKPSSVTLEDIKSGNDNFYFLDPWYDSSWLYRTKITVDSGDVDEVLTNFTVMVYLDSSRINWAYVQDDLDDLRFTTDDEVTLLSYEIESYTANTEAWLWVRLLTVSNTIDTDFYMYYGNAGASSGDDMEGTWDPSYVMVQHFQEATGDTCVDSTVYDNDGVPDLPTQVSGQVDGALYFDGNDYITIPHHSSLTPPNFSVVFWINPDWSIMGANPDIITKFSWADKEGVEIKGIGEPATSMLFRMYNGVDFTDIWFSTDLLPAGTSHMVTATYDGTTMKFYSDDVLQDSDIGTMSWGPQTMIIAGVTDDFIGILDDVRVSNTERSSAWIETSYESGRDHLLTFGLEISKVIVEKDGAYLLGIIDSTLIGQINSTRVTYTIPTVTDWHHYVMTYDDTALKLYMDGALVDSTALTGSIATTASDVIIGSRWVGEIDQLRIYNVAKTLGEIKNHYLNSGHMYSGSVVISDDFRILNTTLDEQFGVNSDGVDFNLNYPLYMPFETWLHHDTIGGADREHVLHIPAGSSTQDRYYYKVVMQLDQPPGVGKNVNMTMTDGTSSMTIIISGVVDVTGSTTAGAFTLDVSAEDLTIEQTQTGGGAAEQCSILIYWYYVENS